MDETIERLAETPKALAHLVAEASDAELDRAAPGEWSARTILAHFRDDEYLCMRNGLERMLAEDNPEPKFMEGADWEPARNRDRDRKEWLLADFALQRQATMGILRMLRPVDFERTGTRAGQQFTVRQFLASWANHDRDHISQLEAALGETLDDVKARRARMEDPR